MIKSASLFVLIATLICGCGTSQNRALSGEQAVKLRHMQTRSFDTKDVNKAMRDVISTMQDLGFIIDHADAGLGSMAVVKGTKLSGFQVLMTVTVRPYGEAQVLVRANARYRLEAVVDPKPYQDFFTSLSKAMFLEANQVK
ncbi:MAG: hypothetical protein OSB29_03730 [Verrucomicrobiota bacterium]|jgi:hypothetical protein|nr:hypothetical protein [Verrucomicrobiota bacterium]